MLQIRAGQRSITANLWSLTAHIYYVIIIVTGGFSKTSFFIIIFRSRHMQMFFKTGVIRNFAICTGKHLCWSLFLIKLQAEPLPKRVLTQVIPVILAKFLRTTFFMEHLRWLLMSVCQSKYSMMGIWRSSLLNQKQNIWDDFY